MSGPERPGEIPPDLPPEYAEAYRRGYERARREGLDDAHAVAEAEHTVLFESVQPVILHPPAEEEPPRRRTFLLPLLIGFTAVLLVAGAYWVGTLVADEVTPGTTDGAAVTPGDESAAPQQGRSGSKRYKGPVSTVAIGGAKATCQAADSADAGGNPVSYEPKNVYDGDLTTAWRCPGDGQGERLTLSLPRTVLIGEVGLVPGYAKTDARSGVDRYAQNNRITKVRWRFSDGSTVVQNIGGSPSNRDMRTIRLPRPRANEVVLEVLASTPGDGRNAIAVSEVFIGAARR